MNIAITKDGKPIKVDCPVIPCDVKLYAVPKDYSSDGLYISMYGSGDIEDVPACAVLDQKLLAHVKVENNNVNAEFLAKGVQCNA